MARPFDERMPSHTSSSMSLQTNLNSYNVGLSSRDESYYPSSTQYNGDDDGQLWVQRKNLPRPIQGSRLAKIRSSPSDGALAAARSTSHGRLHKRGNSVSGTESPASQVSDPNITTNYDVQGLSTPLSAPPDPYSLKSSKSTSRNKVKIKPLLRKLSANDSNIVDLSRSTAEHEGLGIYTSEYSGPRPSVDYPTGGPGYHQRTISANSERSITTLGNQRYGANYVHPMRQTPRPYTPPVANSYKNSLDSEVSAAVPAVASSEGSRFDSPLRKPSPTPTPYAPLPSSKRMPPPLHIRTHSSSRITNSSQTNLPGTPSSLRLQSDSISAADAMSPTARSSLDSAFRKRSRANTANDPAAQAATVQALRQKFNEKEAAKDLRYQQAEAKAQEKETRRREKRDESQRRKSEGKERKRAKSNAASNAASEKSSLMNFGAHQYPLTTAPTTEEIPQSNWQEQQRRRRGETAGSAGKAVQSQWMLFWFKVKTMWLKLKRKMGPS